MKNNNDNIKNLSGCIYYIYFRINKTNDASHLMLDAYLGVN